MVVDGDRKKLENPKRKNALHLHIFCKDITDFGAPSLGGKIYDSQIAFAIKLFKTELTQKTQQK
jgi:hypothetical protein